MKRIALLLPFWLVRWYASTRCEKFADSEGRTYVEPFAGTRFYLGRSERAR